jgi:hypothetical protein
LITIIGCDEGPEADAARQIKRAIQTAWHWIEDDSNSNIFLIPNVQCHGEKPRDLDLVLLALLPNEKATFNPTGQLFFINGSPSDAGIIRVRSLCLVIEIKDHIPKDIRFSGTKLEVLYTNSRNIDEWHPASQQSEKQKYSLRNYLARYFPSIQLPWITNLIWLRNISRDDLPKISHNILPATLTWTALLNTVATNSNVIVDSDKVILTCFTHESSYSFSKACEILTHRINPTNLDRRRMDRIANAAIATTWIENLGKKSIIFEGRGGTGKTVILLGLAWKLQGDHHQRVLFLTYNRALVADLRRLLVLMGLTDDVGCPCIEVQTIHSYIYQLLEKLGLLTITENDFIDHYDDFKHELVDLLQGGVLTNHDIQELINGSPEKFSWDYIFIDEAQDWFDDERDILYKIYPPNHFVIADGHDQLVRRNSNCNWSQGLVKESIQRFQLHRGLRMKANLARFVNSLTQDIGLMTWSIQENIEALGGRIIIVEGDYSKAQKLHSSIVEAARSAGNCPVDLLVCIPPIMISRVPGTYQNFAADLFTQWNYKVWDGANEDLRRTYPTSNEQLRIIQYESCRGLEGWTVFNLAVDDFFNYKISTWQRLNNGEANSEDATLVHQFAARWLMIPCTRAIDTLVLNVRDPESVLGKLLKITAKRYQDFVEWIKL